MESEEPKLKFQVRPPSSLVAVETGYNAYGSLTPGPAPMCASIHLSDLGKVTSFLVAQASQSQKRRPENLVGPLQPFFCSPAKTPCFSPNDCNASLGPASFPQPTHQTRAPGHRRAKPLTRWDHQLGLQTKPPKKAKTGHGVMTILITTTTL